MTSKAFGLAQLGNAYADGALSNRNLIINGAMQVWQRGVSFTVGGSDTYTADRWTAREGAVSRSTDVPASQGFQYSLFYDNDGTRASINLRQKIEDGKALLENREVTLSFWLKSSASTTITVDWTDTNTTSVAVTTSWQRYEISFPATAINPFSIFVGSAWIDFNLGGDHPDIYITGVQLEAGDTATPFEHRSYGQELALCQRYYEQSNPTLSGADGKQSFVASTGSAFLQGPTFKTTKRAAPTMVAYDGVDEMDGSLTNLVVTGFLHVGINGVLRVSVTGTKIDAQVYRYHWSADAEL